MGTPWASGTGTPAFPARTRAPTGRPRRRRAPRSPRGNRTACPASCARRLVAALREERRAREDGTDRDADAADDGRKEDPEEGLALRRLVQLLGADDDEIRRPHAGHETAEDRDDVRDVRDARIAQETERPFELRFRRRERADDHERDVDDRRADEEAARDEQRAENDLSDERASAKSREPRVLRRNHAREAGAENRPPDRSEDETDPSRDDAEEKRTYVVARLPREAPGLLGLLDEEHRRVEERLRPEGLRLPGESGPAGGGGQRGGGGGGGGGG